MEKYYKISKHSVLFDKIAAITNKVDENKRLIFKFIDEYKISSYIYGGKYFADIEKVQFDDSAGLNILKILKNWKPDNNYYYWTLRKHRNGKLQYDYNRIKQTRVSVRQFTNVIGNYFYPFLYTSLAKVKDEYYLISVKHRLLYNLNNSCCEIGQADFYDTLFEDMEHTIYKKDVDCYLSYIH